MASNNEDIFIVEENAAEETAPKENFISKIRKNPKRVFIGLGVAAAAVAGAIVFAVRRQDESDFEDEFPSGELEASTSDETV